MSTDPKRSQKPISQPLPVLQLKESVVEDIDIMDVSLENQRTYDRLTKMNGAPFTSSRSKKKRSQTTVVPTRKSLSVEDPVLEAQAVSS